MSIEYIRESIPCECPTCKGRGIVHKDFYKNNAISSNPTDLTDGVKCKSCNGKCIIFTFKETPIDVQPKPVQSPYSDPNLIWISPNTTPNMIPIPNTLPNPYNDTGTSIFIGGGTTATGVNYKENCIWKAGISTTTQRFGIKDANGTTEKFLNKNSTADNFIIGSKNENKNSFEWYMDSSKQY